MSWASAWHAREHAHHGSRQRVSVPHPLLAHSRVIASPIIRLRDSLSSPMLRLSAFAVSMAVASAVKMPTLDATVGCKNGATYSGSASYGVSYSQWGHLPRGGWRGAVLGPNGDKIYGIPTNASQVRDPRFNPIPHACTHTTAVYLAPIANPRSRATSFAPTRAGPRDRSAHSHSLNIWQPW